MIISLLSSVCHEAHGQKEIFAKEIVFLGNYLAFVSSMSSGTWTKGDIYQSNRVPR